MEYIQELFSQLFKHYSKEEQDVHTEMRRIFQHVQGWKPSPISLDLCINLSTFLRQLSLEQPDKYRWYIQMIHKQHPLTNPILCEISRILCHVKKIVHMTDEILDIILQVSSLMAPSPAEMASSSQYTEIQQSIIDSTLFLRSLKEKMSVDLPILNSHRLLFFVHEYDVDWIEQVFSSCFQDIYLLECIVMDSPIPFSLPKWASTMLLKKIYDRHYNDIQDIRNWNVVVESKEDRTRLLMHPLLPHPRDLWTVDSREMSPMPLERHQKNGYFLYRKQRLTLE